MAFQGVCGLTPVSPRVAALGNSCHGQPPDLKPPDDSTSGTRLLIGWFCTCRRWRRARATSPNSSSRVSTSVRLHTHAPHVPSPTSRALTYSHVHSCTSHTLTYTHAPSLALRHLTCPHLPHTPSRTSRTSPTLTYTHVHVSSSVLTCTSASQCVSQVALSEVWVHALWKNGSYENTQ